MVDTVLAHLLPTPYLIGLVCIMNDYCPVVAGEAGVDASQDHGDIC
jgi:hypothetical protein